MDPSAPFTVARAKPADAEAIADFVERSTRGRVSVPTRSIMERFGAKGLWLVFDANRQIVGLAGWRAENLIARIDDFLVFPFELYEYAGRTLLEKIEAAAQELRCEVSVLLVPSRASPRIIDVYKNCGYRRADVDILPRVWQETAHDAAKQDRYLMLKQLRDDIVTRPF